MKRSLITILFVCLAFRSHGAGTIFINNLHNTGVYNGAGGVPFTGNNPGTVYSSLVTSNGLIFTPDIYAQAGNLGGPAGSQLIGLDFNFSLYGGATAGTVNTLILSLVGTNGAAAGDNVNWGQFSAGGTSYNVPGTTGAGLGFLDLQVWEGNASSFFASTSFMADSGVFANPMGGGVTAPDSLSGMPDMILEVPEPSVFAMFAAGFGASLLRRSRSVQ